MPRKPTLRRVETPCLLTLIVALALGAFLPRTASAAGWATFTPVTSSSGVSQPKISADPAGNQVAVWIEQPAPFKVMAAYRPAGGGWGQPQTLDSTATAVPNTDVANDGNGNFVVVFSQVVNTNYKLLSSHLAAGSGTFGALQQLGGNLAGTATVSAPSVAMDSQGRAFAVYGITGGAPFAGIRAAGAAGSWATVQNGLPAGSQNPDIAVTSGGEATIVDYTGASNLRHFRLPNGAGTWTQLATPALVGAPTGQPSIAVDSAGRTTALHLVASTFTQLATQTCPAGLPATCSARVTLLPVGIATSQASPALAVSPGGDAVAAWTETTGSAVVVAQRPGFAGAWTTATQLGQGSAPAVSFTAANQAIAIHEQSTNLIRFALATAGSAFTPPSTGVTDPATSWIQPKVATDGSGNAFGVWAQSGGAGLQSAIYDAEVPTAPSISTPATGAAGQAITFAASASDKWSGIASYAWDFGDGSTATGPSVTHTYTTPGTYSARVTAVDGAGNQSSQTQTVTVVAAQVSPPPPPPGLPAPVLGKSVNLYVVKAPVRIKLPGTRRFRPLRGAAQLPNGTVIDTRKGRVLVVISDGKGGTDSAEFYEGVFEVNQPKRLKGLANIFLDGGGFKGCPKAPRNPHAQVSARRKTRSVRHLWAKGEGKFRTVGRFSSATVRGTWWLTDDRCNGTLTRVRQGRVAVRDFEKRRTVLVRARGRYFAEAAARRR